jgi:hypothetical protein
MDVERIMLTVAFWFLAVSTGSAGWKEAELLLHATEAVLVLPLCSFPQVPQRTVVRVETTSFNSLRVSRSNQTYASERL